MSQNSGKQLNNWPLLAGLALLLYDYLLTLPTEIHIVWPWPKPWFILVCYLALSTNFTMVVLTFGTFGSQDIITYAILTLRVYALFNRNRIILGLLSLGGLGSLAIGACSGSEAPPTLQFRSLEVCASLLMSRVAGASEAGCSIATVDMTNILIYYFGDVDWLTHGKPFLAGSFAWLTSVLSAVLTACLILNMREVADTDGMAVGDVASEDTNTVEWNDIDGTPMEHIRGHVRNRASWVYGNDLEVV
ncbi:hypothetical protein B0H14DRAFT_3588544 [Mycena olivaceomarginata]|nr:hypothetical protein B0H14DRAFT_3588544 [Mycena olivaceomarginata]